VDIVTIPFGMSPPMSTHIASQRGHFYLGRRGHLNLGATDELPGICSCQLEGTAGAHIFRVVSDEVREERACIDENALHRTYSCRSA
jgi:hypothetical protein